MKKKLSIIFIIISVLFIISLLWWIQAIKPLNINDKTYKTITVTRGESIRNTSSKLKNVQLIRSPLAFFLIARLTDFGSKIQAGEFRLSPSMTLFEITQQLTHGANDVWITIPEGLRQEEITMIFTKTISIPEKEFLKYSEEGYMFPDTYLFPINSDAKYIITAMKNNFLKKVTPDITEEAKKKGLDNKKLITIASLVEREAKFDDDRKLVASVILNRLDIGMKLDIDATIQYALGYQPNIKSWWKKDLTIEDIQTESIYNTYLNPGLPPAPISNPGLAAIKAVAFAPKTDYFYYIADITGKSHFAKTLEEHNLNISKFLNR